MKDLILQDALVQCIYICPSCSSTHAQIGPGSMLQLRVNGGLYYCRAR